MQNKNIGYSVRMLISELLIEPNIAKYMYELREKRKEVYVHSLNVAYLVAETFYQNKGILKGKKNKEKYIKDVVSGALLHDIGKLKISNNILLKSSSLTDAEYKKIKKHPEYGYAIVKDDKNLSELTKEIILSHHEKTNGTGYPNHRKLCDLDIGVQLVGVCDIYDALTEKRAYRGQVTPYGAFNVLLEENLDNKFFLLLASCSDL